MASPDTDFNSLLKAQRFSITGSADRLNFRTKGSNRIKTLGKNHTIYEFTRSMWQALQIHRPSLVFEPAYPSYVLDKEDSEIMRDGRDAPGGLAMHLLHHPHLFFDMACLAAARFASKSLALFYTMCDSHHSCCRYMANR